MKASLRFKTFYVAMIPTLLLHHSVMQFQQNKCPQGVAVLPWSLSKHSAHFIPVVRGVFVGVWPPDETRCCNDLPDFRCCWESRQNKWMITEPQWMRILPAWRRGGGWSEYYWRDKTSYFYPGNQEKHWSFDARILPGHPTPLDDSWTFR